MFVFNLWLCIFKKKKIPCSFQKILNSRPARIYYFLYFSLGFFLDKALNYENIRENFTVKSQSLLLAFCFIKHVKQDRVKQACAVKMCSATYRSIHTLILYAREIMRISLKQDATSPSLHNCCIPPLGAPITFLSRSGTSSLIILSNYNLRFYDDLTKSRSANFVKNLISFFFLRIITIRIDKNDFWMMKTSFGIKNL